MVADCPLTLQIGVFFRVGSSELIRRTYQDVWASFIQRVFQRQESVTLANSGHPEQFEGHSNQTWDLPHIEVRLTRLPGWPRDILNRQCILIAQSFPGGSFLYFIPAAKASSPDQLIIFKFINLQVSSKDR